MCAHDEQEEMMPNSEIDQSRVQVLWTAWLDQEIRAVIEEYTFVPVSSSRPGLHPETKRKVHPVSPAPGQTLEAAAAALVEHLEEQARLLVRKSMFPGQETPRPDRPDSWTDRLKFPHA